jgi:T5SS/PEP-CTERM-associated repeat protein
VSLGECKASSGTASIHGAGSTFSILDRLVVGNAGDGTLSVAGGGELYSANASIGTQIGSTGDVTVDGADSTWSLFLRLDVGDSGAGTLNIAAGGRLHTADIAVVGSSNTGVGKVNVSGPGSIWSSSDDIFIGSYGGGTLKITDGAQLNKIGITYPGGTTIGNVAGSYGEVVVDGPGSSMDASMFGNLQVGRGGSGRLEVTSGGTAGSVVGYIGATAGSMGEAIIDGNGSIWTNKGDLFVGLGGHGTVRVTGGGQLRSNRDSLIGYHAGSGGAATVDGMGSTWINSRDLHVGFNGEGSLTVTNGGKVQGIALVVRTAGEIHGNGNLVGHVQNGGLVSPGTSPGALHIDGPYTQSASGELLIELASDLSYDQLLVTGKATLDGTLRVATIGGFMPTMGDVFEVLRADGGILDAFATLTLPLLAPNLDWNIIYSDFAVLLQVISTLSGDYNADGVVDAADYVVWRSALGQAVVVGFGADGDASGTIDDGDYTVWRANFGDTAGAAAVVAAGATAGLPSSAGTTGSASASAVAPEPGTLFLICLGAVIRFPLRRNGFQRAG